MTNGSDAERGVRELPREVREATEFLIDTVELAHAAYESQLAARGVIEKTLARHQVTFRQLAEAMGISVDSVENLLEHEPRPLQDRLRLSEESLNSLLARVAKRRHWESRAPGTYPDRLHLDSVILRTLLTRAPVGFAILDTDLRFVFVNEALAEINGIPANEHVGKTLYEVVPDLAEEAVEAFQGVLGTGEALMNLELTGTVASAPGAVRRWYESVYRITDNRGVLGLAVIAVEIDREPRSGERRAGGGDASRDGSGEMSPEMRARSRDTL